MHTPGHVRLGVHALTPPTLRGAIASFPLELVLQLLAATGKTGELALRDGDNEHVGGLGLAGGRLVSARYYGDEGALALGALFAIESGEFAFDPGEVEREDLVGTIDELLERGREERTRIRAVREVIPSSRMRFVRSPRAAERGEIRLTQDQWRALLVVDGERDVLAIAHALGKPRLQVERLLADLVRGQLIDVIEPPSGEDVAGAYRRFPPPPMVDPAGRPVTLRGRLPDFPLETTVQLVSEARLTGRIQVRSDRDSATLGMHAGALTSASSGEEQGELALGLAFTIREGEFDFAPADEAPPADLRGDLDALLDRAARTRDRILSAREAIPKGRVRFTLSERAARNEEIVLSPEQWRALLAVDGQRDLGQIAEHLGVRRLEATLTLAELIGAGYVDATEVTELTWPYVERRRTGAPPVMPPPETAVPPSAWGPPRLEEPARAEEPRVEERPLLEEPTPIEEPPRAWEGVREEERVEAPEVAPEEEKEEPLAAAPLDAEAAPVVDDRLAALEGLFGTPEPVVPTPAPPEPMPEPEGAAAEFIEREPQAVEPEPPVAEARPEIAVDEARPEPAPAPAPAPAPPPPAPKRRGLFGLFAGTSAPAPAPTTTTSSRSGRLAEFANELIATYASGRYGRAPFEERMLGLIMRVDEQADPLDRPLPIRGERLDTEAIDRGVVAERQAAPYLAVLIRQVYEDAEGLFGREKARRGFRDARDRFFGKDQSLLAAPDVAPHLPKM